MTGGLRHLSRHNLIERAEAADKDGRIGPIGFSFHDKAEAFRRIGGGCDGRSLCQVQSNDMDTDNQAGTAGRF
jgi:predicted aldo/keto reductase-like oxidoreductase